MEKKEGRNETQQSRETEKNAIPHQSLVEEERVTLKRDYSKTNEKLPERKKRICKINEFRS